MLENSQKKQSKTSMGSMKNFYVHKIHSLISLNGQSTTKIPKKNLIKKSHSTRDQVGNISIKKQKNRQSARRARLRKKLYIDLLEQRVELLENQNKVSETILLQSQNCLKLLTYSHQCVKQQEDISCFLNCYKQSHLISQYKKQSQQEFLNKIGNTIDLLINVYTTKGLIQKLSEQETDQFYRRLKNLQNLMNQISTLSTNCDKSDYTAIILKNLHQSYNNLLQQYRNSQYYTQNYLKQDRSIKKFQSKDYSLNEVFDLIKKLWIHLNIKHQNFI